MNSTTLFSREPVISLPDNNSRYEAMASMLNDTKKPNLLLVEDSEDDAFFFGRTLQKSGFDCTYEHVHNGAEAVDYLISAARSNALPQVIFLDLKMPVLNGFDVLEWMQSQNSLKPVRVVVLSGSDQPSDKERATKLGAAAYFVKPLKTSDLTFLKEVCPKPSMGAPV